MIEIIERHNYEEPKYRFTCSKCESIMDITEDEVKYKGVQWDSYYEFTCPVCGKACTSREKNGILRREEFQKFGR